MSKLTFGRALLGLCGVLGLVLIGAWLLGVTAPINLARSILIWTYELVHQVEGVITAVATAAIAWFTWTIWQINKRQLRHAQRVERAYMSAGGGPRIRRLQSPDGDTTTQPVGSKFEFHINNHGKTPGRLLRIAVEFCEASSVPSAPDYHPIHHMDWIGPGTQSRLIKLVELPTNIENPIVYGRIWYQDIFGQEEHSSGFIQDIYRPTGSSYSYPPPSPEYVSYS